MVKRRLVVQPVVRHHPLTVRPHGWKLNGTVGNGSARAQAYTPSFLATESCSTRGSSADNWAAGGPERSRHG